MSKKYSAADNNPCLKEQNATYSCLSRNHYDKDKCELFFVNYNNCKEFWNRIKSDRRRNGVSPELPLIADRERIKAEYMSTKPPLE
ncbi:unnamed protein product [Diamesa hyperborea]